MTSRESEERKERGGSLEAKFARLLAGPTEATACWPAKQTQVDGYGIAIRDGIRVLTFHRAAWELANGRPVPPDLEVDHLCSNPSCGNPAHLEPVTRAENIRRAVERRRRRQGEDPS